MPLMELSWAAFGYRDHVPSNQAWAFHCREHQKWFQVYGEAQASAAVNNCEINIYVGKQCELTCIPAPRSPSLGNGSLSIMRTGIPFFRSDRARTRPEGPAPTYEDYHERVSGIFVVKLTMSIGCMCVVW
jgi:hypothetical protein